MDSRDAEGTERAEDTEMRITGDGELLHSELTRTIIGAAICVHRQLGPGLLESAYEEFLADEVVRSGLRVERQVPLPVTFKGRRLDCAYRLDLVVNGAVVIEVKAVQMLAPLHSAQLLTYLRLSRFPVGLLINFNVIRLCDGVDRQVVTEPVSVPSILSAPSASLLEERSCSDADTNGVES